VTPDPPRSRSLRSLNRTPLPPTAWVDLLPWPVPHGTAAELGNLATARATKLAFGMSAGTAQEGPTTAEEKPRDVPSAEARCQH
jgi:hypothetical protein